MAVATIADVAERAGVGIGTVSRVLNNSPNVSDATRERVLDAINDLDYRPSNLARALSRGTTNTIGIVVPFFTEPSFVERLRGVNSVVNESEWDIVLFSIESRSQRDERVGSMPRRDIAAAYLIVSLPLSDEERRRFVESKVPTVHLDGETEGIQSYPVDNELGGYIAGRHLTELGHRRLAFVGDPDDAPFRYSPAAARIRGFRRALAEVGATCQFGQVRNGPEGRADARRVTGDMLAGSEGPTAVFASSDVQAVGVMEGIRARGLDIPGDVSVMGFDNIDLASYIGLTTVDQELFESGRLAADWLLCALRTGDAPPPDRYQMPIRLVQRASTGPAPV